MKKTETTMDAGEKVYLCETPHGTRYVRVTNDERLAAENSDLRGTGIIPADGDWESIDELWCSGATESECAEAAGDDNAV